MKRLLIPALLTVSILLACSQEAPTNPPTTAIPAPTSTSASTLPLAPQIVVPQTSEIAAELEPKAEPAGAGSDDSGAAVAIANNFPSPEGTYVISSTSSSSTPRDLLIGEWGFPNYSASLRAQPAGETITVSAVGKVTVMPDEARIVVFPEEDYGPFGPQRFTRKQEQDIIQALVQAGIDAEAVSFESIARYEPQVVSVLVGVNEVEDQGEVVVEAVEEIIGRAGRFGVSFGLTDAGCTSAAAEARREAIPAAQSVADDLGLALSVERGEVVAVLEYPLVGPHSSGYYSGNDLCTVSVGYGFEPLAPFHAMPMVDVAVGVQISYRLR